MATVQENRLSLRAMEKSDLVAAFKLTRVEKWPHRLEDWDMMLTAGNGVVAEMSGEIVATAMWFPCGPSIATLGMVLVSRTHRGGGIGRIVVETAMERSGCATMLLISTKAAVPLYRKMGFNGVGEILQHQGAAFSVPIVGLEAGERIRPLGSRDGERVAALIANATGLDRPAVVAELLANAQTVILDDNEEVAGVACFRRFGRGYVIGPVIAPDINRAKALISHWLGSRAGEFTRLDIPADCGLSDWLEDLGISRVDNGVTMIAGDFPRIPAAQQSFAIISQAFS